LVPDISGQSDSSIFKVCWTSTDGLIDCPEMSQTNYKPMLPHIPEERRPQTTINHIWVTLAVQMYQCTQVQLHWVRWLVVLDITALDHQQNSDIKYDWQSPVQTVHGHDLILALHLCDATLLLLYAAW